MNRTFYIFRHGETDWNKERRIQGHTDTKLNETGVKQAQGLIQKFENIQLDIIYTSDLSRAYETAQVLAEHYQIPLIKNHFLREMSYGDAEGMKLDSIIETYGDDLWSKVVSFRKENDHIHFPNGETRFEARSRLHQVVYSIINETNYKTIGLSTHGGALRNLLHGFLDDNHPVLPIPNCVVYKFEFDFLRKEFIVDVRPIA